MDNKWQLYWHCHKCISTGIFQLSLVKYFSCCTCCEIFVLVHMLQSSVELISLNWPRLSLLLFVSCTYFWIKWFCLSLSSVFMFSSILLCIYTLHGFSYHYADGHTHLMLTNCWFNCDADSFYSLRLQLAKMADYDRCSKSSFYDITIFVKI